MGDRVWLRDLGLRGFSSDYEDGFNAGAAVAFGLIGMAEAIRTADVLRRLGPPCVHCRRSLYIGEPCFCREDYDDAPPRHGTGG